MNKVSCYCKFSIAALAASATDLRLSFCKGIRRCNAFLRVKSFERLDRGNAHVRTLIVKGIKQKFDGTSVTDLPQRPCNVVIDVRVFQEWNEHRDGVRIAEFP